ncbi:thiol-disulfide oxidoreductase DCC family protein [Flavilitoribacter nigricans]|uniref:DUF393 domain-containing protein n=1 Tax=Flavilitoribacter nigricans (strain ATCC 23147 / DSM 23189 / NBRC 102662 / NCIMB 1420 / SS-2) TaxID=1122177 RepID=A0A2D0N8M7_FLAN2|nr:hypothetical protein [Flavilitoribacter nigricans]PHN04864.1 hypothetical protein CRP01_20370 [Flavilitoribacter nigricans DSM 23189 = NBRC 102662]
MNTLKNQTIIYDDACPMCTAYTGAFIRLGWLEKRLPFSRVSPELLQKIDVDRGRHEIPLFDPVSGQTVYGLDALFLIIGTHLPWLKPLLSNRAFRFFWKQIYWIITYNRRIIAGSRAHASGLDCAPDRNLTYRWMYILLMLALSSRLLWLTLAGSGPALAGIVPASIPLILSLLLGLIRKNDRLSWLGNWITVIFIFALGLYMLPVGLFSLVGITVFSQFMLWKRF